MRIIIVTIIIVYDARVAWVLLTIHFNIFVPNLTSKNYQHDGKKYCFIDIACNASTVWLPIMTCSAVMQCMRCVSAAGF